MKKFVINGGKRLNGEVEVSTSKNAILPILAASILADKKDVILECVPSITDVERMLLIIESIGGKVDFNNGVACINSENISSFEVLGENPSKFRASYYMIGSLLGRFKKAKVALPGGCPIGERPIDQHIKGFKALGATVELTSEYIYVEAKELIGTNIFFDVVSVGATINIMLAAVFADGVTTLENVAKEPHVVDVANFLNTMGANIKGAGTDVIRISGIKKLSGCMYQAIPDQIEAGTYMIAAAAIGEEVTITNVIPKHLEPVTAKLLEIGIEVIENGESITVKGAKTALKPIKIQTLQYPGFPTDLQQPMGALLSLVEGTSTISERVYENRFLYLTQLEKMGVKYAIEGRDASITGTKSLNPAVLIATDLRAGASLIIAGLCANGTSEVLDIDHVDRGYYKFDEKLKKLGADITRLEV
ncbi:MAG: UDP-N-acetylglucosamine 1-carboxyvinyltransferase [Oscillospiraceae bacterium]|nr:UDP-N-acetylglucosamine 1-carboxyvinyltransferase [Oscillospiraceae bacterium]